jgi:hypothetical protein
MFSNKILSKKKKLIIKRIKIKFDRKKKSKEGEIVKQKSI